MEPYRQLTVVGLEATGDGTRVVMTAEPMHDEEWAERLRAGRANELENLARVVAASAQATLPAAAQARAESANGSSPTSRWR